MKKLYIILITGLIITLILCINFNTIKTPTPSIDKHSETLLTGETPPKEDDTDFKPLITEPEEKKLVVVIDAGHGGKDPGTDKGAVYEKDIALDVALKLAAILKGRDISTYLTREDDTFIELADRIGIANEMGATLFISLHCDSFTNASINGATVHYNSESDLSVGSLKEKEYASIISKEYTKHTGIRSRGIKESNTLAVVRLAQIPSVLIELGFVTGDQDHLMLFVEDARQKIAEGLANGIEQALQEID